MSKRLFELYKDYFRLGAAVSGIFLKTQEELEADLNRIKKHIEEFKKTHPQPPANGFKIEVPKLPKGPFPDLDIVKNHFNLIVAENDTKMESVYKGEDDFSFTMPDSYVKFAKDNSMDFRWHTLVWHNQSPKWIFEDKNGNNASRQLLEERLKKYIFTIGERYSKDVCSVDVVNECISDKNFELRDGNDRSRWFDILGPDYVDKAFLWAKEAFPHSNLVINDYNLEMRKGKREGMYRLVKGMLERNIPVDTVGLQMHINYKNPPVEEIKETLELFGNLGLNVIVTEMEVSAYIDEDFEHPDPRKEYTKEFLEIQAQRYYDLFECFKYEAKQGFLKDVVLWGITDRFSWKNGFPAPGRTDCCLLFDNEGKPKPAFDRLTK